MNKIKRRSAIVVITSVLLLAVLALSTGIGSVDSHSVSSSQESSASLGDWNGTWINVGTMLDDPAMDTAYEAIADAANAAAGDGAFTADDARNFLYAMLATSFGDLGIAENNVTYYNVDGTVRCECEYESAGVETVAFDDEEFDWYKFELTPEDAACSEYKYLIFTAIHSHEDGMVHFHMRYGNTSFDDLISNPNYAMWYPTFGVEGTTAEEVADGFAEDAEMLGYMMLASQGPKEWHVNESESIQVAIDNATDGDTVIVHEGIYEEQLYIAKSIYLKAAEGERPEIRTPEPEELESYVCNLSLVPWSFLYTPIIMADGSSNGVLVNISGFVINGSSVTAENSEYGICGIVYHNASGIFEDNEVKNIWGRVNESLRPLPWNGDVVTASSTNSNVTIRKNYIHNYTGDEGAGVFIYCGANATVTQNYVSSPRSVDSPDQCGIEVGRCSTATVSDNIVTGHLYKDHLWYIYGISFWDSNGTIQNNTLIDNQVGICVKAGWARASSSVTVRDNIVNVSEVGSAPGAGIMITTHKPLGRAYNWTPALTATVTGNKLSGTNGSGTGIVIGAIPEHKPLGTVNATITRNTVSDWDYGIELLNSSNSTVYLNDFVNNKQSVFVNESTNAYSSPEEIDYTHEGRDYTNYLGNYWSDYAGEDATADGIGDTSYEITGDNPDRYPLMAPNENYEQIGILVIAHGSPSESWCKPVREAVENVSMRYPTEVGFLEFVPNQTINVAVDKLDEQGVTKIIAVPLFISSHSGHIAEIEYVLGLRETLPGMDVVSSTRRETPTGANIISSTRTFVEGVEMERSVISREGRYFVSYTPIRDGVSVMQHGVEEEELVPVDTTAEIVLTNAMDDHSFIAQILADRAAELCTDPTNETVVFVAHGTWNEAYFAGWVENSESLAEKVKLILRHSKGINIKNVACSFMGQPKDYPVDLSPRTVVENVSSTSYPVVVPLMVSEGFLTGRYIPNMLLAGLDYGYPEKGKRALTPHESVANWIEVTAAKELTYPTIPIYDDSQLLDMSIEEVGAYHGDICICLALGYRGTQLAIADLWDAYEGEVPHRGDFKVICASPTKGIRDAFEYITNATGDDFVLDLPAGTDIVNLTSDNFRATIIRKSTNESVTIRVKEGIFPERFFELRTKKKLGTATKEEKKAFKLLWENTKEKALYKPVEKIFEEV